MEDRAVCIGVLALQGSFREHVAKLSCIPGVTAVEVRTKLQLESVDGLIIPGGESTTMALIAERFGLIADLKQYAGADRPIWGTCAGLIFLANRATGQKAGGQALLGGLDVLVSRNFFGAQINSFEALLPAPACFDDKRVIGEEPNEAYRAMFIRAPAVMEAGPSVEVLAEYQLSPSEQEAQGIKSVAVAVRSGNLLATAFHPELTDDPRWHLYFVESVRKVTAGRDLHRSSSASFANGDSQGAPTRRPSRPADLPVFGRTNSTSTGHT